MTEKVDISRDRNDDLSVDGNDGEQMDESYIPIPQNVTETVNEVSSGQQQSSVKNCYRFYYSNRRLFKIIF